MIQTNVEPKDVQFERPMGEWVLSIFFLLLYLVLFAVIYPWYTLGASMKLAMYPACAVLALFVFTFYQTFIRPYAFHFTPEGDLLLKSVFLARAFPASQIESITITSKPGRGKSLREEYTLQIKGGDPLVIPNLGPMPLFVKKLSELNPGIEILDRRTESSAG